ncbi:hypothetical protein FPHYL_10907 [Fusarium phyllophilum]|uniref:Carbohydrate kinase PfkB domain-containing protein n=1 Tax=Fusarium phyllophilum TaxID=47803 RepID=A0A8H5MY16_9HYPO|nr:hypothetical protein FPHYL_10907 [Fusarium phyllophilum]
MPMCGNASPIGDQPRKKQSQAPVKILEAQSSSDKVPAFNGQDMQKEGQVNRRPEGVGRTTNGTGREEGVLLVVQNDMNRNNGRLRKTMLLLKIQPLKLRFSDSFPISKLDGSIRFRLAADPSPSVPFFPSEDSKLRATSLNIRRGGNCPNSLQVLEQLLSEHDTLQLHLVSPLPAAASSATQRVISSFGAQSNIDFSHCVYREESTEAASSYIMRSETSGSRTLVNYNDLLEMTEDEFGNIARGFNPDQETWWHFEGRIPDTIQSCIRLLRNVLPKATISVEIEKPGREGLPELAAEADVVFYSRSWAESRGHKTPEQCLRAEGHKKAAVGAGDTFIAGMLYGLICHPDDWSMGKKLSFAVRLATLKVQREGFDGLGRDMLGKEIGGV